MRLIRAPNLWLRAPCGGGGACGCGGACGMRLRRRKRHAVAAAHAMAAASDFGFESGPALPVLLECGSKREQRAGGNRIKGMSDGRNVRATATTTRVGTAMVTASSSVAGQWRGRLERWCLQPVDAAGPLNSTSAAVPPGVDWI